MDKDGCKMNQRRASPMSKTVVMQPGKTLISDNNVYAFYCVAFA